MTSKISQTKPHLALSFGGLIFWATQAVNFVQDITAHHFTADDKTFVAATVAMAITLIGLYLNIPVQGAPQDGPLQIMDQPAPQNGGQAPHVTVQ